MLSPVLKADRLIGSGAAGSVYLVHDLSEPHHKAFALKVLNDLSATAVSHFEREVLFLSRLRHRGLVSLHGFSKDASVAQGVPEGPCYWMDYVEGRPIDEAARDAAPRAAARWLEECLEALDYIHGEGILHGDLKPANILIGKDGARLLDFGLATLASAKDTKLRGSLPYLAPEALKGERKPASDLFSLGVVFYEVLAGRHPRAGAGNLSALFAPEFERLEDLGLGLPPRVARIIDRLIEIDPDIRFKSARDVLAALRGETAADRPPARETEPFQMTGREREWAAALEFVENRGARGGVLLVRGLTGTGKTRFARELYFEIALRGFRAERGGDRDAFSENARREIHRFLQPGTGFLILEINDDRIGREGASFCEALAREEGVRSITLSPEGFQDAARLASETSAFWKARLEKTAGDDLAILRALAAHEGGATAAALGRVAGLNPLAAEEALARLTASGLVRHVGGETAAPAVDSLPGVVLDGLSPAQREALHRSWMEESAGDKVALARHALELPHDPGRQALVSAAAETLEHQGRFGEAVRLYRRALERAPSREERDAFLRGLANVYGSEGLFRESIGVMDTWFSEFPSDPEGLNPVKYGLATGVAYKNLGELGAARRRLEDCLKAAREDRPSHRPRVARAHALLGEIDRGESRFEDALRHYAKARALLLDASEQKAEVFLHEARLEADSENPNARWDKALIALDDSEAVALQIGSRPALFAAVLERGNLCMKSGHFGEAADAYERALSLSSDPPDDALRARALQNRGILASRRGRLSQALSDLTEARRLLLFFGSPQERTANLSRLAAVEAALGRFEEARRLLGEAEKARAPDIESDLEAARAEIRAIETGETALSAGELKSLHDALPDALKIGFEERPDYQIRVKRKPLKTATNKETSMDALQQLNSILRDLLTSDDVGAIMARILDGAVQIARAQRGFLVTSDEQVKAAKNLSKDFLKGDEFKLSLSAVREAMKSGETVLTDNASLDPRFKTAASVQELDLKSVCVIPLKAHGGVIGVLYLDHPYQAQIFQGADLNLLKMFADQAALALQKAQTIEGMKDEIVNLKKEVEEQRLQLTHEYAEIVGQSRPMMEVLSLVDRLVDSSIPVWIFGESGTGKEAIARALHFKGPRAKKAFVSENCSSLPETLLESELFGHKKGSFTHADRDKKGLLHHADGGTVFLDEIADMSATLQAKLLRFLQEGEIRPVGSTEVIKVDVRVVSASNKDLNQLVADGKFREDLFYRLNGMTVALPPLRDRVEDIPLLVQHFLKRQAAAEKKEPLEIAPEALELLTDYSWPGNVRELENTIRSAALFHYKGKLLPKSFHFKKALFQDAPSAPVPQPAAARKEKGGALDERTLLLKALQKTNFHKGEAAEELGISRRYLYTQMEKFGIPTKRMAMKAYVQKALS